MKRALTAAAVLLAAVAVLAVLSLPPASLVLEAPGDGAVPGVVHVHTDRSDGLSSPDEVAAAAARAGLSFVIFTDHGDATRQPDPPMYRSGVLCIDAVEISTSGGHYVAIGLPAAPYPLRGEARDVVEDVRRMGGLGFAAHPDSPKAEMQWADWHLPFDGVEILNLDTIWRRFLYAPGWQPKRRLLQALLAYPLRPEESIGNLLTVSDSNGSAYAALVARRVAPAIVTVDAHAKVSLADVDPGDNRWALPFPGYEIVFNTLQVRLWPAQPLTGDANADAALIIDALGKGRLYGVNVSLAAPPAFEFFAEGHHGMAPQGSVLDAGTPATLRVRSNAPPGFETILFQNAEAIIVAPERTVQMEIDDTPAVYRVEIRAADRPGRPVWIVSNPIYVRPRSISAPPELPIPAEEVRPLFDGRAGPSWRVENDAASRAVLRLEATGRPPALRMEYALGGGPLAGQFAALIVETPEGAAPYERLALRLRADGPARVSVQARVAATSSSDERWVRSVFVDQRWRDVVIDLGDMRPLGPTRTPTPPAAEIHSFVFAMELTNTAPGSEGALEIERAELER